jgi:drug/metabolite transporter (DMT)-like permease
VPTAATGRLFALASALGYGASLPLSRLAFDHGTNALTVAFLRYLALTLVLHGGLAIARRGTPRLTPRQGLHAGLLGACFAVVSLGTLLGTTFMPVSLTVLVFYTHPSLILAAAAVLDRRRPSVVEIAVVALAFAGLALALDVSLAGASATGLALASMAALGALASFVIIERALAEADALRATAVAATAAGVVSLLALAAAGGFALPASATGWLLLGCVVALFASAVLCMFLAIRHAGAVPASMMLCLEPVTSILLALLLLGEHLDGAQWLGATMVVAAVAIAGIRRAAAATDGVRPGQSPADQASTRKR